MDPLARIGARIAEIRAKASTPPAAAGFAALLDSRLSALDPAPRTPEPSTPTPGLHEASVMGTPWTGGTVSLGTMLGLGPAASVPPVPVDGVATRSVLEAYLTTRGIRRRNGRLGAGELVGVSGAYRGEARLLPPAAAAWEQMRAAAAADGVDLRLIGAYRTYESQARAHQAYLEGRKGAPVLPPGESEHGLGLAVDVTNGHTVGPGDPEWGWLQVHARDYGWYPIRSESWHWEFRGLPDPAPGPAAAAPAGDG